MFFIVMTLLAMEDAHCAELDLDGTKASFFGVYDGHGGNFFMGENTHKIFLLFI